MPKVLIIYHSHGGNTRQMAEAMQKALTENGCSAELVRAKDADLDQVRQADGLLLGTPCYFGNMSTEMKDFIDKSIALFGKGELTGKPAGAFASTGAIGGCGELAIMSLITGMLIHGCVVQGSRKGGHLGPLSIGTPDERVMAEIEHYGAQFAGLVKRLSA